MYGLPSLLLSLFFGRRSQRRSHERLHLIVGFPRVVGELAEHCGANPFQPLLEQCRNEDFIVRHCESSRQSSLPVAGVLDIPGGGRVAFCSDACFHRPVHSIEPPAQ